jgi:hypothetical protein
MPYSLPGYDVAYATDSQYNIAVLYFYLNRLPS